MSDGLKDIFAALNHLKKGGSGAVGPLEWIIAGLGNIGREYEQTRHNAGFMALDMLAEEKGVKLDRCRFQSMTAEVVLEGKRVLLMKPNTLMNRSGLALGEAAGYYKIPSERLLVIYDDISLEPGRIRLRREGSAGGHNGIKSIIDWVDSQNFPRIKIGVGKKPHPDYNLADWVLSRFKEEEKAPLKEALKMSSEAARMIVSGNMASAMNKFN